MATPSVTHPEALAYAAAYDREMGRHYGEDMPSYLSHFDRVETLDSPLEAIDLLRADSRSPLTCFEIWESEGQKRTRLYTVEGADETALIIVPEATASKILPLLTCKGGAATDLGTVERFGL